MKTKIHLLLISLSLGIAGCGQESAQPGKEGGACQIGQAACDEGLRCNNGTCVSEPEEEQSADLSIEFVLENNRMPADGASRTVIEMLVTESESGDAFEGNLLVYPSPSTAGRVDPGEVVIEDGLGFFEYISCNRAADLECPSYVTINVARAENPLRPIAGSEEIRLDDPASPSEGQ